MTVDDWNGMGPLDESGDVGEGVDERARRTIEASSLGTDAARALRAQMEPEVADTLLARIRARLAAEGLPGGMAAAEPRENADDHAAVADHAGVDVVGLSTDDHAEPSPVVTAATREDRPAGWPLNEEHVGHLMLFYFRGPDAVLAWARDEDPRRARVLEVLANRIEEVTDYPAGDVTEALKFREDLGVDSLDAVEISTAMEDEFHLRVSAAQLASLNTVGDAIDLILGHADGAESAEFEATMGPPPTDGPAPSPSPAGFPVAPTTSAAPTRKEQTL